MWVESRSRWPFSTQMRFLLERIPDRRKLGGFEAHRDQRSVQAIVLRRHQVKVGAGARAVIHHAAELMDAPVNPLRTQILQEAQPGDQALENGAIVGADHLKARGFELLLLIPSGCRDVHPQLVQHFFPAVEQAASGRGEQPFVRAAGEEVAGQIVKIDGHLPVHVGAVDDRDNAFRARRIANLLYRHDEPGSGGDAAEAHHARSRPKRRSDDVGELLRVLRRNGQFDLAHLQAVPGCRCSQQEMPPGCSWSVVRISSPLCRSSPLAMVLMASVALCIKASSSFCSRRNPPAPGGAGRASRIPSADIPRDSARRSGSCNRTRRRARAWRKCPGCRC